MNQVFLIDGIRTAIGSFGGSLSSVRTDDLAAAPIRALIEKYKSLSGEEIDEVILGCANQAGEDNRNVARMAALLAGLPQSVPAITVNRLCASGMSATVDAGRAIAVGDSNIVIAGGVEHMTRAPFVMNKATAAFSRSVEVFDTSIGWRFVNPKMKELYGADSMGETAENVAAECKVSREDQDVFAYNSQRKAKEARERGRFRVEIMPLPIAQGKNPPKIFDYDEFIRVETTIEALAKLKPAFKSDGKGSVTAGNSSGINDGACALLLASESAVKKNNLKPLARIVGSAAVGVAPRVMGLGPIEASRRVLQKTGLSLDKISVIELNEAFAAQSLACTRELGLEDNDSRVNPNGGAIALGHPLGMSGARLILTAALELQQRKEKYALCAMCVGVGQGTAIIIERV